MEAPVDADIRVTDLGTGGDLGREHLVAEVVAAIRDHGYCAVQTPLYGQAFADVHRAAREAEEELARAVKVVPVDQRETLEGAVTAVVLPICDGPDDGPCSVCSDIPPGEVARLRFRMREAECGRAGS